VMEVCDLRDIAHVQPSHLDEIGLLAPKEQWPEWVDRCEKDTLTVVDLRSKLMGKAFQKATKQAESKAPTGQYSTIVVDPRLSLTPAKIGGKMGKKGCF